MPNGPWPRVSNGSGAARCWLATGSFVVDGADLGVVPQWSSRDVPDLRHRPERVAAVRCAAHLDLVHPDDRAEVRAAVEDALAGVRAAELDHRIMRPDGEIGWVFLAVEPARDAAGALLGARGVCQDVTARKQADIAVRAALERERAASHELRRLDRAKEEFLATVSHELRTPLTAILGFSSLLRGIAAEHDQLLEPIERNASDMAQMVERLLDYSRLEAGGVTIEPRSIDLGELIAEAPSAAAVQASARRSRPVDVDDYPPELAVRSRPVEALERILVNLIGNAAKYSERPAAITVAAEPGGQGVIISVADEGPGIDEEAPITESSNASSASPARPGPYVAPASGWPSSGSTSNCTAAWSGSTASRARDRRSASTWRSKSWGGGVMKSGDSWCDDAAVHTPGSARLLLEHAGYAVREGRDGRGRAGGDGRRPARRRAARPATARDGRVEDAGRAARPGLAGPHAGGAVLGPRRPAGVRTGRCRKGAQFLPGEAVHPRANLLDCIGQARWMIRSSPCAGRPGAGQNLAGRGAEACLASPGTSRCGGMSIFRRK